LKSIKYNKNWNINEIVWANLHPKKILRKDEYIRNNILKWIFFISKNKIYLYKKIIDILEWYLQKSNISKTILKKLLLKRDMQNSWSKLWNWDKLIEMKSKIITKLILKKTNAEWWDHQKKISKKKMLNDINFSNLWPGSSDQKLYKWKNIKSNSNKSNVKTWNKEKKINYTKWSKRN